MLECCSLHFNRKIAKSLKKVSNSGLKKPLKSSKFWIFSEMLTSAIFFVKFQCFHKKITKSMFLPPITLINDKYKYQKKKVELETSMYWYSERYVVKRVLLTKEWSRDLLTSYELDFLSDYASITEIKKSESLESIGWYLWRWREKTWRGWIPPPPPRAEIGLTWHFFVEPVA